jgi:hypothetical protein
VEGASVAALPSGSLAFALQGGRQLAGSFKALSATVFTVELLQGSVTAVASGVDSSRGWAFGFWYRT